MKTFLPQNQFITNSGMPNPESAVASKAPPVADATAAPFSGGRSRAIDPERFSRDPIRGGRTGGATPPTGANEPTSSTGGPQEAPAGSAPNTAAPAGAHWEGRLWLVLAEVLAFEPIDLDPPPTFLLRDRVPGWI